ncbi:MAG: cation transporter [Gammaproteobacteria bacterium]|nr:cation transporter [Gammaproteobacteria bacterium]
MAINLERNQRYIEARKVTLVGSVVDFLLGVAKIFVGLIDNSQALIADGVHSLSDLVTDVMVLVAVKHGSRDADDEHPYGHGRIETLMTVALGLILIAVAAGIAQDAIRRLFLPELLMHPGWFSFSIAAISVVSKEAIYHYTIRAARKLNSELLRANAWHSRTDAISSVIVIIGILGSMAGLEYLDSVAAVGVAVLVAKIGWELSWKSARELIDTGLDPEYVERIKQTIIESNGIRALHMLRTRRMGSDVLVDVHVIVDPKVSVSEGHQIGEHVRTRLTDEFPEINDVTVHADPEDDESSRPSSHLPARNLLLEELNKRWAAFEESKHIKNVTLHYLDGAIHVEIQLPLDLAVSTGKAYEIAQKFSSLCDDTQTVNNIKVLFTP